MQSVAELPENMAGGDLTQDDEIEVGHGSHIPADRYTVKGWENGQIVLKDGVEVKVDPWDQIDIEGRKATGEELQDIDVPFGGERPIAPETQPRAENAPQNEQFIPKIALEPDLEAPTIAKTSEQVADAGTAIQSGVSLTLQEKGGDKTGEILALHDRVIGGQTKGAKKESVVLGSVDSMEAKRIKDATDLDVAGYNHTVDNLGIRHAYKNHGDEKAERNRGQQAISRDDFAAIHDVISSPDKTENGGKNKLGHDVIRYQKKVNGNLVYVEEQRTGKKELAFQSMWKVPTTKDVTSAEQNPPSQSPETLRSNLPLDSNIPQGVEKINPITIEPLREKSILVKGDHAEIKTRLTDAGVKAEGYPNEKLGGLVYSKKHEAAIRKAVEPPKVKETPESLTKQPVTGKETPNAKTDKVDTPVVGAEKPGVNPADHRGTKANAGAIQAAVAGGAEVDKSASSPGAFIKAPDGTVDFGEITPEVSREIRREAAKIRMQQGEHSDTTGKGFGLAHIMAGHAQEIEQAGFHSVPDFIKTVASSYNQIFAGEQGRLLLVKKNGGSKVAVVELRPWEDGAFYSIVTGYLSRSVKGDMLWPAAQSQTVDHGGQPAFAGESVTKSVQTTPNAEQKANSENINSWEGAPSLHSPQGTPNAISGQGSLNGKNIPTVQEEGKGDREKSTETVGDTAKDVAAKTTNAPHDLSSQDDMVGDKQEAKPEYGTTNKVFTADAAEKARELLRKKLGQLNAGLDPEMMQAGITLAGYHIEAGARTFGAYSKAMVADLGDAIKPYLKSFYNAVRSWPGFDAKGMSDYAYVDGSDVDAAIEADKTLSSLAAESGPKDVDAAPKVSDNKEKEADHDQIRGNDEDIPEGQRPKKIQRPATLWGTAEVLRAESDSGKGNGRVTDQKRDDGLRGGRDSQVGDVQPVDFRITGKLGQGGAKTKFRGNLDAIKLVGEIGNRHATQEEQAVLARYVGWGGIPQAFYRPDGTVAAGWESEASELKALLSKEDYEAARSTTQDAHYTSTAIIGGIYKGLARLGFTGGKILEPSVGAGNFIGLMPTGIKGKSKITAVEIDKTTSAIAKLLYPQQTVIHSGFQDFTITPGSFDLALGNPPFGSKTLFDAQHPGLKSFSIHNYFFAKSLIALREDGLLAMVVSSSMMDKAGGAQRLWLSEKADLLGAIRLPNNAFKGNAGTEVTTDIIFLRKRAKGEPRGGKDWQQIYRVTGKDGVKYDINQYFANHPEMMLGDLAPNKLFPGEIKDGAYDAVPGLIAREGESIEDALASAIERLPEKIYKKGQIAEVEKSSIIVSNPGFARPYGYTIDDKGQAVRRRPDVNGETVFEPVLYADKPIEGKRLERFAGMMRLRDAVRRLIRAELDDSGNMEALRRQLNSAYDKFVSEFGYISETANSQILNDDPTDFPLLRSLEVKFDKGLSPLVAKKTGEKARKPSAKKAAIFTVRTRQPYRAATSAADAKEALVIVLREDGFLDLSKVASLYGATEMTAAEELEGVIFVDPATEMWETADNYLSGNVKKKLAQAKEAGLPRNIAALEKVQPADVPPEKIQFKIGAAWMPGKYYEGFASDVLGQPMSVQHHSKAGLWSIQRHGGSASQYDTARMSASEIFGRLLEVKDIAVYDLDADKRRILNKDETSIAQIKATEIERAFSDWMLADMDRAMGMAEVFNDKVNTNVELKFDGGHMIFPGMGVINADKTRDNQLREHQKNVVWRMIQKGKGLLDHVVGSGKTFAAIATGMELRRMGLIKKPIYVVPNHLVAQWSVDFQKLYPGANVLTVGKADFSKTKRMEFVGRIATGDWDAVLMAHSSFGFIKSPSDYEAMFYQDQIAQYDEAIKAMRSAEGKSSWSVKQAEKSRDRLKEKLKAIADKPKDDVVDFSELGVDALFTDEAHEFKNLFYVTKRTRVSGLGDPQGSKKAFDMFVKTQYILEKNNGRGVFFMTGTPVSNTIAEMYTMMRYLDYGRMQDMGIKHFDQWAGMFADVSADWEVDPTGTRYRLQSSFRGFINIPGMMGIYKDFSDVITQKNLVAMATAKGEIWPVPDVKGGKPELVVAERSPLQASFMQWIIHRMDNMPKDPREDNPLTATGEAMKGSLDIRLINESLPDYAGSKVNLAVGNVLKINQEWADKKGTQLIFCDLSVPKKAASKQKQKIAADRAEIARLEGLLETAQGEKLEAIEEEYEKAVAKMDKYTFADLIAADSNFSVYDDVKAKLIAGGMKEGEIAFIHDANTDAQKEELFGKVRSGQIRVLMGSTMKMGAGMNVQNKLVALHHLDAPWRPSDLEQREGRIIRQGNEFFEESLRTGKKFEVGIYRYATKESLDTRRWQVIERKAKVVEQLRGGGHAWGEMIEDASGEAANAAEMKAAASGNPLILDEIKLRKEIDKIAAQKRGWQSQRFNQEQIVRQAASFNDNYEARLKDIEKDVALIKKHENDPWQVEVNGEVFAPKLVAVPEATGVNKKEVAEAEEKNQKAMEKAKKKLAAALYGGIKDRNLSVKFKGVTFDLDGGQFHYWFTPDLASIQTYADFDILARPNIIYLHSEDFSATGFVTRMNNMLNAVANKESDIQARLIARQKQHVSSAETAKAQLAKGFDGDKRLEDARKEHAEVLARLQNSGQDKEKIEKQWNAKSKNSRGDFLAGRGVGSKHSKIEGDPYEYGKMLYADLPDDVWAMLNSGFLDEDKEDFSTWEGGDPLYSRANKTAWPDDFPNATTHTTLNKMKSHPDYEAAKAGDIGAAGRVVADLVSPAKIKEMKQRHPDAIVLAPHAMEAVGRNAIPRALAEVFGDAGFEVNTDVVQTNEPHRTQKDSPLRLALRPEFAGKIESGREYILLDDAIGQGGTIAELRFFVESNGGKVVDVSALTSGILGNKLSIRSETITKLEEKFSREKLENFLYEFNTAGRIEALTEKEGRFILRQPSLDSLRDRILADAQEAGIRPTAWQVQTSFSRLADQEASTGTTIEQVKTELRSFLGRGFDKLTALGKVNIVQTEAEMPGGGGSLLSKKKLLSVENYATVTVGDTPSPLVALGAKQVPLVVSGKILNKVMDGKHEGSLTLESLLQVHRDIYSPLAILRSDTHPNDSVVILTEVVNSKGSPVVVPVHIAIGAGRNIVNSIKSIYGKDGESWVQEQIDKGNLLYVDTEKAKDSHLIQRLHLPTLNDVRRQMRGEGVLSFQDRILTESDIVKTLYSQDGVTVGMYIKKTGKLWLVADHITEGDAKYIMLHEGGHALMKEDPTFAKQYDAILDQFEARQKYDYRVQDAFKAVPRTEKQLRAEMDRLPVGNYRVEQIQRMLLSGNFTPESQVREEALMYFVQNKANHETSLFKKIIANIRMWLMRMGIPMKNFTTDDLVALFTQGVKGMADQATVKDSLTVGDLASAYSKDQDNLSEKIQAVYLRGDEIAGMTPREARRNAREYLKEMLAALAAETGGKTIHNTSTGQDIGLTVKGATHGFAHKGEENVKAIVAMRELIENAARIARNPHDPADDNMRQVHTYVAPLNIGGKWFAVKLTAKERWDGTVGLYDHQAFEIEEPAGISGATPSSEGSIHRPAAGPNSVSIAHLLTGFKGKNEKYLLSAQTKKTDGPMFSKTSPMSLENLEETAKTMGSITVKKRGKTDSTFLDRLFSTPEYYFKKFAAAGRVLQAALARRDVRFTKEQEILGKDFVTFVQSLRKENREAYDEANDYLIDLDQSGKGFSLKEENDTWKVVGPDGNMISLHETEAEAVAAMVDAEAAHLGKNGYSAECQ